MDVVVEDLGSALDIIQVFGKQLKAAREKIKLLEQVRTLVTHQVPDSPCVINHGTSVLQEGRKAGRSKCDIRDERSCKTHVYRPSAQRCMSLNA